MGILRLAPRNFWELPLLTLTGDQVPATGYEYINTQTTKRSKFFRSASTTGQYLRWSLSAGSILHNWLILGRHHCHGGSLRYRSWANNNFTGTMFVDTGTNPIYIPESTGYNSGYDDASGKDTHDPMGLESNYSVFFAPGGACKSGQIDLSSKSTTYNYNFWEIGYIFMGNYFEPLRSANFGLEIGVQDFSEAVDTRGGSNQVIQGARRRLLNYEMKGITPTEYQVYLDAMEGAQIARTVAVSAFPGEGGRTERDGTIIGKFSSLDPIGREYGVLTKRFQIKGI